MNALHTEGLVLLDAGPKGLGVFATKDFCRESRVLGFCGPEIPRVAIHDFTHVIQVGRDRFLGASGGMDDFVNHSCDPNSYARATPAGLELVARRPILRGDEVTFDYSTCMVDEPDLAVCCCGSSKCRGVVQSFSRLPRRTRTAYQRAHEVPAFAFESNVGARAFSRP